MSWRLIPARSRSEMASLNALMTKTLGQGRSNVEKLRISTDDKSRLRQQGVLKKGIKVPFDVKSGIEATPDGRIRMHAAAVRGFGLPLVPSRSRFSGYRQATSLLL